MTSEQRRGEDHEVRLMVRAELLGQAEKLCRRECPSRRGWPRALVLAPDAACSGPINTGSAKKYGADIELHSVV
jgi:hypothetical protein